MTGQAIKHAGLTRIARMMPSTDVSSPDLKLIVERLEAYEDTGTAMSDSFRGDYRYCCQRVDDMFAHSYVAEDRSAWDGYSEPQVPFPRHYHLHSNRTKQALADRYRRAAINAPRIFAEVDDNLFVPVPSPSDWIIALLPNGTGKRFLAESDFPPARLCEVRCGGDATCRLVRILVALKAYKVDTGDLPPALDVLVPGYIASLPVDPYDGEPIRYSYDRKVVYSVGRNLKDDNGDDSLTDAARPDWPVVPRDIVTKIEF